MKMFFDLLCAAKQNHTQPRTPSWRRRPVRALPRHAVEQLHFPAWLTSLKMCDRVVLRGQDDGMRVVARRRLSLWSAAWAFYAMLSDGRELLCALQAYVCTLGDAEGREACCIAANLPEVSAGGGECRCLSTPWQSRASCLSWRVPRRLLAVLYGPCVFSCSVTFLLANYLPSVITRPLALGAAGGPDLLTARC